MKVLNISGGGTKVIGLFGAAESLYKENDWQADVITGISAGAIIALPIAMGKWEESKELLFNLQYKHFFKHVPVNSNGSLRIWSVFKFIFKLITFQHPNSIGDFSNIEKTLKKLISREEFNMWQKKSRTDVWVGSVSFSDGSRQYVNLRKVDYDYAFKAIRASASIPIFCQPVQLFDHVNNQYHWCYDGGVRDFIASTWVVKHYGNGVTEMVDIYSKPMNNKILTYSHKRVSGLLKILNGVISIMQVEISKGDEMLTKEVAFHKGIFYRSIYLPVVLEHVYDTNKSRLKLLYQYGYKEGKKIFGKKN